LLSLVKGFVKTCLLVDEAIIHTEPTLINRVDIE